MLVWDLSVLKRCVYTCVFMCVHKCLCVIVCVHVFCHFVYFCVCVPVYCFVYCVSMHTYVFGCARVCLFTFVFLHQYSILNFCPIFFKVIGFLIIIMYHMLFLYTLYFFLYVCLSFSLFVFKKLDIQLWLAEKKHRMHILDVWKLSLKVWVWCFLTQKCTLTVRTSNFTYWIFFFLQLIYMYLVLTSSSTQKQIMFLVT